eukprot:9684465-Alexandrium_andersonii.AAC.1
MRRHAPLGSWVRGACHRAGSGVIGPIPHPGDAARPPEDGDAVPGEIAPSPHGRAAATEGDMP